MLSNAFFQIALVGAEWVLYLLVLMSILSVALIFERFRFYREANEGLSSFRKTVREGIAAGQWDQVREIVRKRKERRTEVSTADFDSQVADALLNAQSSASVEVLGELAHDSIARTKIAWEKNLAILATIGSNAPFVGLVGTVLGIIQAFNSLASQQTSGGSNVIMSGISEALVATAVGIFVAIPAVVAFNMYQRKVKAALSEAEALRSFIIGQIHQKKAGN